MSTAPKHIDRSEVVRLRKEGLGPTAIAEKLGVAGGTINYHLKMAGLTKHNKNGHRRAIKPIVYGQSKSKTVDVDGLLNMLWNRLSQRERAEAIRSVLGR